MLMVPILSTSDKLNVDPILQDIITVCLSIRPSVLNTLINSEKKGRCAII